MIEFFFLSIHFFIIYFLLSFNILVLKNFQINWVNFSLSENITFNSIVFLNFILILSFFNLTLYLIIKFYLIYISFLILIYIYRFKNFYIFKMDQSLYLILLFICSLVIFLEVANNLVIGWDAQKFWIYKTLNFYNGNTIKNLSNLPNPDYPHLGVLSWSFFWKISFLDHEYSGRLFYVFLYLSSLLLIIQNLRISHYSKIIFFIFLIIISYDYTTYHSNWSMFSGYQEILIFSLVVIAMHFLYKLSNNKKKIEYFEILSLLLICNLLVWIKYEGLIISSGLILTLLIYFNLNNKKKLIVSFIFFTILLIRFNLFDLLSFTSTELKHVAFNNLSLDNLLSKITFNRIFIVSKFFLLNLLTNYLILSGLFILFISSFTNKNLKRLYYIIFFGLFNIFSFCGIYLITDLDLNFMATTMDRIIYQFSPFVFLIFLETFKSKKIIL
jgi:hypothetical protein